MLRPFIAVLVATVITVTVHADEPSSELAASAYWKKPFDGVQRHQNEVRYGLRFDQSATALSASSQPTALQNPAIVDLEFNQTQLRAYRVNGYNALPQYTVFNVDGTSSTNWTPLLYLGGAALAMCIAGSAVCERSTTPDTVTTPNPCATVLGDIKIGLAACD